MDNCQVFFLLKNSKSEPLVAEMSNLGIYSNCASKKEHVSEIDLFNRIVKERFSDIPDSHDFEKIYELMVVRIARTDIYFYKLFSYIKT